VSERNRIVSYVKRFEPALVLVMGVYYGEDSFGIRGNIMSLLMCNRNLGVHK
jgi:hypothetical protein